MIVGVAGINFYARTPGATIATVDVDLLLEPAASNLRRGLSTLAGLGFSFEAGGEPFLDLEDEEVLQNAVTQGACISAIHPEAGQLDLMLSMQGFRFDQLREDATRFEIGEAEVLVGSLPKLLHSKELAGRPKDQEFLRAFLAREQDFGG